MKTDIRWTVCTSGMEMNLRKKGEEKRKISIVYYPDINMYQGRESLQVIIRHYQFD